MTSPPETCSRTRFTLGFTLARFGMLFSESTAQYVSLITVFLLVPSFEYESTEEDVCNERSCYPATGNLLIGRKKSLTATSTCGLHGRQRYCIVSHLEEQTKCFYCDSRTEWQPNREPYKLSHRIENVVSESYEDRHRNWWQSENGVQNVSIRLDLEAEFHFTHLIMTFKSFRPAAMIIERSADYAKTWSPYRYFAYDCQNTFPNIPEGPPKKHTDIICTRRYSDVAPSTGGELVYKVISPHIPTENPYADEIANLLKVTNIRINFTKLHTLGDDLLDYRPEIDEKYYYAIYEIVVRGSCSCYGHAQRCIPMDGSARISVPYRADMVHGRCECTHNTKGLNCEQCMDFFNDLPWRPAIGDDPNECKRCECNGHAARCHFDRAVYQASGFVSGGVCDECIHNTQGKNCEQCKPYFYRNPDRPITDPYVCLPCKCNKIGSLNDGICEGEEDFERGLVAGKCYCKPNVEGSWCERCKNGFWKLTEEDPNGCRPCSCNLLGSFNNEGCNKETGECLCKRLVTGSACDMCLPEHYGLSDDPDGCKPCHCDIGGSIHNNCDIITGQCICRENFSGRRCDAAESGYYCPSIDHFTFEAEEAEIINGHMEFRERLSSERDRTWTGDGFVRATEKTQITFKTGNIAQSMHYRVVIRYELLQNHIGWENIQLTVVRPTDPSLYGVCKNLTPSDDFLIGKLHPHAHYVEIMPDVCLEEGVSYEIRMQIGEKRSGITDRTAAVLIDSIVLIPPTEELFISQGIAADDHHRIEYDRYQCREQHLSLTPMTDLSDVCVGYICPIAAMLFNRSLVCECDPTGSLSGICAAKGGQCDCKPNVVGRRCDKCAVGTYGFGPSGCAPCECDSVGALNNNCDPQSGQCNCKERGITGRQCNQCQPGFWSFPDCRVCQCNDHASVCDQKSGACIECRDLTDGYYCDRCKDGYYGDPRLGINLPCKPCPCPGGLGSGFQHADTCYLRTSEYSETPDVVCNCREGYTGERCSSCALNHWGNPNELGGTCEPCDCNGNIDVTIEGSCDAVSGDCIKCLHNTEGVQCEYCIEGYYGDAKIRSCQRCVCNELGTNKTVGACNRATGQCPCLSNVVGKECDACAPHHFDLASGKGCEPCGCDPTGVILSNDGIPELQCNELDGLCYCKPGRGGRTCSDCENYHWGDPTTDDCRKCECDRIGSATQQCDRSNGSCVCLPGSGGTLCNMCARGYTGEWPHCEACGECFRNWDEIVKNLKNQVTGLIEAAKNVEDTGVASIYDDRFEKMEKILAHLKVQLESADITRSDINELQNEISELRENITLKKNFLNRVGGRITEISSDVDQGDLELNSLLDDLGKLAHKSQAFQDNATLLRVADVQGAYNITRESAEKSFAAKRRTDEADLKIISAESIRQEAVQLLDNNRLDFEKQFSENGMALVKIGEQLTYFETVLPKLNKDVCGAETAPCDELCGGPGLCGHCGGRSCLSGSVSKAEMAKKFADEADQKLDEKQKEAEEILDRVRDILQQTSITKSRAKDGHDIADAAASQQQISLQANQTRTSLEEMLAKMNDFMDNNQRSSPEQIRALAEEITVATISLTPAEIEKLSRQVREKLQSINNIDVILNETRGNKTIAEALQKSAELASMRAAKIRNVTTIVREALTKAGIAQNIARDAIKNATKRIMEARNDLNGATEQLELAETSAMTTNQSLAKLDSDMKDINVQYLSISEDTKYAYEAADKAVRQAEYAETANEKLKISFENAKKLLSHRNTGNELPQARAEELRKRATQLLHKTQRHRNDISQLSANIDAFDVRLADYSLEMSELHSRIDTVTAQIHKQIEYYSTCDI
ncbi:unnamed protein product [Thelazia callipaeda]|uniref:Laminin subunit beta-1 n=1 Tax=Thelazia callipaeda TaxID=103827 RepID=A0A0N5D8X7_THECL|nr:unnamed protein product [Thelazia callipaeda]